LNNIKNIDITLSNNVFQKNHAKYGGSIFIYLIKEYDFEYRSVNFINNTFDKNKADYFGGSFYFKNVVNYINKTYNNKFINNIAEIAGGVIFTCKQSFPLFETCYKTNSFSNNKANYYGNEIASLPNVVLLNNYDDKKSITATSGIPFSLSFELLDQYNQTIKDNQNYQSNFLLKAELLPAYDNLMYGNDEQEFYLENNECSFSNGHCILNNLRVIAHPGDYQLHFSIDYDIYEIYFLINDISIKIEGCNREYAEKKGKYDILYCEKPVCNKECINGECKFSRISSPVNNHTHDIMAYCICFDGFEGEKCNNKIYEKFRINLKNYKIFLYTILTIESICLIITCFHKKT